MPGKGRRIFSTGAWRKIAHCAILLRAGGWDHSIIAGLWPGSKMIAPPATKRINHLTNCIARSKCAISATATRPGNRPLLSTTAIFASTAIIPQTVRAAIPAPENFRNIPVIAATNTRRTGLPRSTARKGYLISRTARNAIAAGIRMKPKRELAGKRDLKSRNTSGSTRGMTKKHPAVSES